MVVLNMLGVGIIITAARLLSQRHGVNSFVPIKKLYSRISRWFTNPELQPENKISEYWGIGKAEQHIVVRGCGFYDTHHRREQLLLTGVDEYVDTVRPLQALRAAP